MKEVKELWITTVDNPYDPFTQFEMWQNFDEQKKYFTCNYLARLAKTSYNFTEYENNLAINEAISEIERMNVNGLYKVVENKKKKETQTKE